MKNLMLMIKSLLKGERKGASKRLLCLNVRLKISNPCENPTSHPVCVTPCQQHLSGCLSGSLCRCDVEQGCRRKIHHLSGGNGLRIGEELLVVDFDRVPRCTGALGPLPPSPSLHLLSSLRCRRHLAPFGCNLSRRPRPRPLPCPCPPLCSVWL
jgi:hypothetical protein